MFDDYKKKLGIPKENFLIEISMEWEQRKGMDTDYYSFYEIDPQGNILSKYSLKAATSMHPPCGTSFTWEEIDITDEEINLFQKSYSISSFCGERADISNAQSIIQGQVVGVSDGDTITVIQNNKQYKIRLYGIDCPEKKQACGQKAKQFTSDQVFRQSVRVVSYDIDRYGRVVGVIYKGNYNLPCGLCKP